MWQAQLTSADRLQDGRLRMVFTYSHDDGRTFDETVDFQRQQHPGDNFVVGHARQILTNLEAQDAFFASLQPGKITIDDPEPTAADLFFAKHRELQAKKAALAKEYPVDAETVAALEAEVKALFDPEFTADFRWSG